MSKVSVSYIFSFTFYSKSILDSHVLQCINPSLEIIHCTGVSSIWVCWRVIRRWHHWHAEILRRRLHHTWLLLWLHVWVNGSRLLNWYGVNWGLLGWNIGWRLHVLGVDIDIAATTATSWGNSTTRWHVRRLINSVEVVH